MNDSRALCRLCGKEFDSEDALRMHSNSKHPEPEIPESPMRRGIRKLKGTLKWAFPIIMLIALGIWWFSTPHFEDPPYKFTGQQHVESYPSSNFVDEPIPIPVQIHILEHARNGQPGALAQYNCNLDEQECKDLAEELKRLISDIDYQGTIYVAPYHKTEALIVLSGRGKIEKFESFDETKIRNFFGLVGIG